MAIHKYDKGQAAAQAAITDKLKADTSKKITVKDLAERVADLEVLIGIRKA